MGNFLSKGFTYTGSTNVTETNLNTLVDDAIIKSTAISALSATTTVLATDEVMINSGGTLKKATAQKIVDFIATAGSAVPAGTVMDYAGATAPAGYFLCYGQAVSRTTYAALFAAIGTAHGAGDGSTFNLPDLRGRATTGLDNMGGTSAARMNTIASTTLGGVGGAQTHTLTTAQLAAHGHNHANNLLGYHVGAVNGNYGLAQINVGVPGGVGFNGQPLLYDGNARGGYIGADNTQAGSNGAHNNLQPSLMLNKIIKY